MQNGKIVTFWDSAASNGALGVGLVVVVIGMQVCTKNPQAPQIKTIIQEHMCLLKRGRYFTEFYC